MRKVSLLRTTGLVAAALMAAWSSGAAQAEDAGLIRISDRSQTSVVRISDQQVVRGQSPVSLTDSQVQPVSLLCPSWLGSSQGCSPGHCQMCEVAPCDSCIDGPSYHEYVDCSPCGFGHKCPVIGWTMHFLKSCHDVKAHYWAKLGLPTHCCLCRCRDRCPRERRLRVRSIAERQDRRTHFRNWLAHSKLNYFNTTKPPCGHYTIVYPVDPWYGDQRDAGVYSAEGYGGPMSVPLAPVIRHTFNYGWGVPSSRLTPVSHLAAMPYYGYGPPTGYGPYGPGYAAANGPAQGGVPAQSAANYGPALR